MACFVFSSEHDKMLLKEETSTLQNNAQYLEYIPAILSVEFVKTRISKVISETKISVDEAIQCLEEFDYCFKLSSEEERLYKEGGYLFPNIRPKGSFVLGKDNLTV